MNGNGEGEITAAIADFVIDAGTIEISQPVFERAKTHILDSLGLALAGSVSDAAQIVHGDLQHLGVTGRGCVIAGTALRAPARFAAFANATAIHADNFDDTTPQAKVDRTGGIHASGCVLPVVLALAEECAADGAAFLRAYLAGVEVSSRLNHAIAARHYADGFHTTGTMNVFGAVAAASVLKQASREVVVHALGVAASNASGVRRNFGSMAEILHPAQAAQAGIAAVELAIRGLTAAPDALDGPVGYFAAAAGGAAAAEIVGRLGAPWVFESPGVWIKPHPNGALTHPGAGCLLGLLESGDIPADRIEKISVRTNDRVLRTLIHHNPDVAMQAKFSMEFTLAVIALDRRAGLADFTDEVLNRPDIREMMARVDYTSHDGVGEGYTNVTTLIDVALTDGSVASGRADHAMGSTNAPMDSAGIAAKFRQCAAFGRHPPDRIAAIEAIVSELEAEETLTALAQVLSGVA